MQITATVSQGEATVSGATVVFSMTKPGGGKKLTKYTATTNAAGVATWNYSVGRRDALGSYSVSAKATYNSRTADSTQPATFTVQ